MPLCLVTGGAGFVGSHLVAALVARGDRVRVLDDFSSGSLQNLNQVADLDVKRGSILNETDVRCALEGVAQVFHFADLADGAQSETPHGYGVAPIDSTSLILAAARDADVQRVIFASSGEVYGGPHRPILHEAHAALPLSHEGFVKLAGERDCVLFTEQYGLDTVRLRFFNIFGPRQSTCNRHANSLLTLMKAMLTGADSVILDAPTEEHDWLCVHDAVHGTLLAAAHRRAVGRVYNIARGRSSSLLDAAGLLGQMLGRDIRILARQGNALSRPTSTVSIAHVETELGFCPCSNIRKDFAECLDHYAKELGVKVDLTEALPRGPHIRKVGSGEVNGRIADR